MAEETKTMRQLIDENRRLRESVDRQTRASEETSSKLGEVGGVIKNDLSGITDAFTAPVKQFVSAIPGLTSIGKIVGILAKPKDDSMDAGEVEQFRDEQRAQREQTSLLATIAGGILDLKDTFLEGLQKGAGFGLGAVAALIAAPVITLVNFFKALSVELKFLNSLTSGRLANLFKPFVNFFNAIEDVISKAGTGQILKGDTFRVFGRFTSFIQSIVSAPVKLFRKIMNVLNKFPAVIAGASATFEPIAKFAAGFGRLLGKIFLPITILMSAFDFITGFMRGFSEDGIIGGIREGIIGVVDGFVGGLLRMITGAFAWIMGAIGLDNFAESLTTTVNASIESVYDIFRGVVDIITLPFRLVFETVKGIFGFGTDFGGLFAGVGESIENIFSGLITIITAPFNMLYGLIQDIFSFVGFELPDIDIGKMVTDSVTSAIQAVKDTFNMVMDSITNAIDSVKSFFGFGDSEELEQEVIDAQKGLRSSERNRDVTERAIQQGNVTVTTNGVERQATNEDIVRIRNRVETEVFIAEQRVIEAEEALVAFNNAPKFSDFIPSWEDITGVLSSAKDTIVNSFKKSVAFIPSFDDIFETLGDVKDTIVNSFKKSVAFIPSFDDIFETLGDVKDTIVDSVRNVFDTVKNAVIGFIPSFDDIKAVLPSFDIGEITFPDFSDFNPLAGVGDMLRGELNILGYSLGDMLANLIDPRDTSPTIDGARETGGPVRAGDTYIVGESGPELFTAGVSGQVINNNKFIDGIARQTANMVAMADAERSALDTAIKQVQSAPPVVINNSPTTVNSSSGSNSFIPVAISNRGIAWQGNDF